MTGGRKDILTADDTDGADKTGGGANFILTSDF